MKKIFYVLPVLFVSLVTFGSGIQSDYFFLKPATLPSSGTQGEIRYDSSSNVPKVYDGSSWVNMAVTLPTATVQTKTASFTASYGYLYLVDTSAGDVTATLTTASGNSGSSIQFYVTDGTNNLIIDGNGTETIDGSLTKYLIATKDQATIVSDGTNLVSTSLKLHGTKEYGITSLIAWSTVAAAGAYGDFHSLSLEPGTWVFKGFVNAYNNGAVTDQGMVIGISTTSGNSSAGLVAGNNRVDWYDYGTSLRWIPAQIQNYYVSPTATTTYYLKGNANTSTTNLQAIYYMQARMINW